MTANPESTYKFLGPYFYTGLAVGLLYWIFDAAVMTFFFNEGSLREQILSPGVDEAYIRGFTWAVFAIAGAVINHMFNTRATIANEARDILRMLENAHSEFYVLDAKTMKFLLVNSGTCRDTGYSIEELRQLTPLDLAVTETEDEIEVLMDPLTKGTQEEVIFETRHRRKNGTDFPVEVHLQRASYQRRPAYVAFVTDTTQRQTDEEEK